MTFGVATQRTLRQSLHRYCTQRSHSWWQPWHTLRWQRPHTTLARQRPQYWRRHAAHSDTRQHSAHVVRLHSAHWPKAPTAQAAQRPPEAPRRQGTPSTGPSQVTTAPTTARQPRQTARHRRQLPGSSGKRHPRHTDSPQHPQRGPQLLHWAAGRWHTRHAHRTTVPQEGGAPPAPAKVDIEVDDDDEEEEEEENDDADPCVPSAPSLPWQTVHGRRRHMPSPPSKMPIVPVVPPSSSRHIAAVAGSSLATWLRKKSPIKRLIVVNDTSCCSCTSPLAIFARKPASFRNPPSAAFASAARRCTSVSKKVVDCAFFEVMMNATASSMVKKERILVVTSVAL